MNRLVQTSVPGTTMDPPYPDLNGRFVGETDYYSLATGANPRGTGR